MLPNLIIIGAMKAGTTSLHHYLGLHPQISMSRRMEPHFFVPEMNWSKGVKWYEQHFGATPGKRLQFETSNLPGTELTLANDAVYIGMLEFGNHSQQAPNGMVRLLVSGFQGMMDRLSQTISPK